LRNISQATGQLQNFRKNTTCYKNSSLNFRNIFIGCKTGFASFRKQLIKLPWKAFSETRGFVPLAVGAVLV
jgi:hypothetical protein